MRTFLLPALVLCVIAAGPAGDAPAGSAAAALFPDKGAPKGWLVRAWDDVKNDGPEGAKWTVDEKGVLHGSEPRGTWLMSEKEYGDFILELEFKIGPEGNSGVALRAPLHGDPAYDGMELQIVDPRYYINHGGPGEASQLTGSLYNAIAPKKQVLKPEEWNKYEITCRGPHVKVVLNGETIQDVNLDEQNQHLERGSSLKDRPRKGHIGFQELSRAGGHVQIRNATIRVLDGKTGEGGEPAK